MIQKGRMTWAARAAVGTVFVLVLSGCELQAPILAAQPSAPATAPTPRPVQTAQSAASLDAQAYYTRIEQGLLTQGLLRTDGGGPDTPFTARDLVENFMAIAFFEEYAERGGQLVARPSAIALQKWTSPIVFDVQTSGISSPGQASRDRAQVASYVSRLSRLTGHPMRVSSNGTGNYKVLFVSEDERSQLGPRLRNMAPGVSSAAVSAVVNMSRSTYCVVLAVDPDGKGTYGSAVAVIRAEHPDLMRLPCIHEELAQGLGLANDSPRARPSIFNDDEEFALLTTMDEMLLKILYNPRLRPGMSAAEGRPIVTEIATALMGGAS